MSNQDLLDYCQQLHQANTDQIASLNQTIGTLNWSISQAEANIQAYNDQITASQNSIDNLMNNNTKLDQITYIIQPLNSLKTSKK